MTALAAVSLLLASCNPAKRVAKGHYLLTRNSFRYRSGPVNKKITHVIESTGQNLVEQITVPPEIAPEVLINYVKQKPNTKLLRFIPLHLLIYNIFDSAKTAKKKEARDKEIDEKYKKINEKRIADGKLPVSQAVIKAKKNKLTFREKITNSGEPPVILDSALLNNSRRQIAFFLADKGYYNCKVRDSVVLKDKKAKVFYIIIPGKPYKIASIHYTFEDTSIAPHFYSDTAACLIKRGMNFDYDLFQQERDRITRQMNDEGYFGFDKGDVYFKIDSSLGNQKMMVTIVIRKMERPVKGIVNQDSSVQLPHPLYRLRKVVIQMEYNPQDPNGYKPSDTVHLNKCMLVFPGDKPTTKPKTLLSKIYLRSGAIYRVSDVDNTYAGLADLKAFRYVNVKMVPAYADSNLLDCYIQLMPVLRQSVGLEGEFDNTGGDLGVQGDILYENKNCFRGGEDLTFKLKGGLEEQTIGSNITSGTLNSILPNTVDFGGEMDFRLPRVFPNFFSPEPQDNPQTLIKVLYDYQNRPTFYSRGLFGVSYEWDWFLTRSHNTTMSIKPIEWSYDNANLFPSFENTIIATNNYFLENSFSSHLITDMSATLGINNQVIKKDRGFGYFQLSAEMSGLLPFEYNVLLNHNNNVTDIAGVPYSYYYKFQTEYRRYFALSKYDKVVIRALIGYAVPLANTYELPFDKSFWAGGSDDIRGFEARALGPGNNSSNTNLDEIGDEKIEMNAEYRFNLIKIFNLAFFCDAGNVWLHNNNPAIPNANFMFSGPYAFYNQIALSPGIGLRLDFTYFVVRFDFGFPWHDPGLPDRQFFNVKPLFSFSRTAINLGIGYPF